MASSIAVAPVGNRYFRTRAKAVNAVLYQEYQERVEASPEGSAREFPSLQPGPDRNILVNEELQAKGAADCASAPFPSTAVTGEPR
jgi:hypothetical protein